MYQAIRQPKNKILAEQQRSTHIGLMIDGSGSMARHTEAVIAVTDAQIKKLQKLSLNLNQEMRISIYNFADNVECMAFDMDVMRFQSIRGHYRPNGLTALIDAMLQGIQDHSLLPQVYGDHAFIMYAITDGMNNVGNSRAPDLKLRISALADNWTIACLVPDVDAKIAAMSYGFPAGAFQIWDPTAADGYDEAGTAFETSISNFMAARATGVRGVKDGLFTLNSASLRKSDLKEIPPSQYYIFPVRTSDPKGVPIKEFVEMWTKQDYRLGSTYYQPTKKVKIQNYKNVLVQDIRNGRVYEGIHLRQLLGLPDANVEVNPGQHKDWRIFIQSTSVNRKLFADTFAIVRK